MFVGTDFRRGCLKTEDRGQKPASFAPAAVITGGSVFTVGGCLALATPGSMCGDMSFGYLFSLFVVLGAPGMVVYLNIARKVIPFRGVVSVEVYAYLVVAGKFGAFTTIRFLVRPAGLIW